MQPFGCMSRPVPFTPKNDSVAGLWRGAGAAGIIDSPGRRAVASGDGGPRRWERGCSWRG
jgi:hypothetical protein